MRWLFPARVPDRRDFPYPVHDGDTLWLQLDKGHREHSTKDVRLIRVFMPELKEPGGPECHEFVLMWLSTTLDVRWPLTVETFTTRTGNIVQTLGRYVGEVWTGDPDLVRAGRAGVSLNQAVMAFAATHPEWGGGVGG